MGFRNALVFPLDLSRMEFSPEEKQRFLVEEQTSQDVWTRLLVRGRSLDVLLSRGWCPKSVFRGVTSGGMSPSLWESTLAMTVAQMWGVVFRARRAIPMLSASAFSKPPCSRLGQCGPLGQMGPGFVATCGLCGAVQAGGVWWARVVRNVLPRQGTHESFVFLFIP